MTSSQGNDKNFHLSHKDSFNIVYSLARGHSTCFLPFFRKNFGSEALGWPGFIAFIIMLLVGSFGRIPEMWLFLGVWTIAMLYQRASTTRARRRGIIRHSRYDGDVDTKLIKSRTTVKQVLEPLACVVFGVFFEAMGSSHGFALFIGWGAFSLCLVATIDRQLEIKRLQAMRDAEIEQRCLAARYRGEIEEP